MKLCKNYSISAIILTVLVSLSLSCGGGQVRYEIGRMKNIKRVAIVHVSMFDGTAGNNINQIYGQVGQLMLVDGMNQFAREIQDQLKWNVISPVTVLNSRAMKRFNQYYENYMQKKHGFLYPMAKKQRLNLAGTKNLMYLDRTPEMRKAVADLCAALRVDGLILLSFSYAHSTNQHTFGGTTKPCVFPSMGIYDKNAVYVVSSSAGGDYKMTCSKKKFKMSFGFTANKINLTEDYLKEMILTTRQAVPEAVMMVRKAVMEYEREEARRQRKAETAMAK